MANSRVGNYQLQFSISGYASPIRSHLHGVYVLPTTSPMPGTPVADIACQLRGGGSDDLQSVADLYASFLRNFYPASISVENFTLWRYVTQNQKDFIAGGTAVPTTSGSGTAVVAQQVTFTYRTAGGSILKQVFLEPNIAGDAKGAMIPNAVGNTVQRMGAYVLSASSAVIGVDNTFPVAPLFAAYGENERVWRKIYRG